MEPPPHPMHAPTSSPPAVDASIVVCTFRRPQLLRACLDSLASQANPFGAWDVVVIDNCPDGSARATVRESGGRLAEHGIEVRYVAESKSGVSHARNRGLAEARHPLICFLDDDERALSGWLTNLLEPFANLGEAVDIVAGEVDPDFGDSPRPDWLADEFLHMFSCRWGWDTKPRFLQEKEWFGEGNVAFRKRLFAGVGFDPALGRRGDALTASEGVVFTLLRQHGARAFYAPDAKVSHFIHPERLSKKWMLHRQFFQGMSDCHAHRLIGKPPLVSRITLELHKVQSVDIDTLSTKELKTYCHVYYRLGYFVAVTTT
ncbi:MAG: glycosyltransferase family 2 protein [Planctomycetia bacterium]